jgi:hypothetical protein
MKEGFFFEKVVLPLVVKVLRHLNIKSETEMKILIENEIVNRNLKSASEVEFLIDSKVKQLNEVSSIDFDDRETNLRLYIKEYVSSSINDSVVETEQSFTDRLEKNNELFVESLESILSQIELLNEKEKKISGVSSDQLQSEIAKINSEFKQAIIKSRADAAAVVKNTRDKLADLDEKLDAFIDTISERFAVINKNRRRD